MYTQTTFSVHYYWTCLQIVFSTLLFAKEDLYSVHACNMWLIAFQGPFVAVDKFIEHFMNLELPDGK